MIETLKAIRVFLASPSDLGEERQAARSVVDELNRAVVRRGYHIDLMGWEDTIASYGRPQSVINKDVEVCGLFIGMLYKHWGSRPGGRYTSGFEEEFQLSVKRREKSGQPDIKLFFKEIPAEDLKDGQVGPSLEKVIAFKRKVTRERKLIFQPFKDIRDFESKIRLCIWDHINDLEAEQSAKSPNEDEASAAKKDKDGEQAETASVGESALSTEGQQFLQAFSDKIKNDSDLSAITEIEVARFRLLANSIFKQGNDKSYLGVHDANLLYEHRGELKLGTREVTGLARCGLRHLASENVPLWHWYARLETLTPSYLVGVSYTGQTDKEKIGALVAMRLLGAGAHVDEEYSRKFFVGAWLSENASQQVKLAALSYLRLHGVDGDLELIELELNRSSPSTLRQSVQTLLSIKLRYSRKETVEFALMTQFDSIDTALLNEVLSAIKSASDASLLQGLEHRNPHVRIACVSELCIRGRMTTEIATRFTSDSNPQVRYEALKSLTGLGIPVSGDQVRDILVKEKPRKLDFRSRWLSRDYEGVQQHQHYLSMLYKSMKVTDLEKSTADAPLNDSLAYFVLCDRFFAKWGKDLRRNVDDKFKTFFDNKLAKSEPILSPDRISNLRGTEETARKELTRKALNLLCQKGEKEDLHRIRKALSEGYVKPSERDFIYLRKKGAWEDISLIIEVGEANRGNGLMSVSFNRGDVRTPAAAICELGRGRLAEVLALTMPSQLQAMILESCDNADFVALSNEVIGTLLRADEDEVRKAAALKAIESFGKNKLTKILAEYDSGPSRYYNVVHWLDLGVSLPRKLSITVVKRARIDLESSPADSEYDEVF